MILYYNIKIIIISLKTLILVLKYIFFKKILYLITTKLNKIFK